SELEAHGLVRRTVHPTVPPQVEYAITPLGLDAIPVIQALQGYGERIRVADQRSQSS
ncbi:MAG: hypothetical protein RLZZ127_1485, partial [Planctomycetota bacterium]